MDTGARGWRRRREVPTTGPGRRSDAGARGRSHDAGWLRQRIEYGHGRREQHQQDRDQQHCGVHLVSQPARREDHDAVAPAGSTPIRSAPPVVLAPTRRGLRRLGWRWLRRRRLRRRYLQRLRQPAGRRLAERVDSGTGRLQVAPADVHPRRSRGRRNRVPGVPQLLAIARCQRIGGSGRFPQP